MKQSFLIRTKNKKSYMEAIATLAYSSRASYRSVLNRLEECCSEMYKGRSADDIVEELKSIDNEQRDDAYCGVLQDYVNWLTNRNLSHNTISNHFAVVVHYFSYHGIRAHPTDLRQKVKRPTYNKKRDGDAIMRL